ncbi:MAG: HlyD family efflux transporter periplasmic adaptor subunit [Deltaproteobacteria bacterium]|nr:HlyD family efflux transporter periplasmic adaptor subunit [Deltaproteobacteria bacterium]
MSESLFSTYWYRVANLSVILRDNTVISRHVYRGEIWYVLRNSLNGRHHRFNSAAYSLIGQMDGQRTVQQLWDNANKSPGGAIPTQDEVIRLLGLLHDADLIQSDILPSTVELFRQVQGTPINSWKQRISNPFFLRLPLCDPDRFLKKWGFLTAPLFTRGALAAWLGIVMTALAAAVMNWPELSSGLGDQLFLPSNLLLAWITYPLVKILHEFGHAFAVKKWGGEVHELGIMLLALTPIPYVDATASASFPEKQRRIAVAAVGMMIELLLASLALFVWLNVEAGLVSALSYNVMLIGGVSTLLFNGNPLLRYDGYYILADLLEIPNLGQRANRYLGYLVQRHLLGIETAESPVTASSERIWFLVYGPLSCCYRIAVLVGLVWLVSSRFFVVGILIALWGTVSLLILPTLRGMSRFLSSPAVRYRRSRLMAIGGGTISGLLLLLFVFPMPLWTTTQGVIWLPEQSVIRAGTECEVVEVLQPVKKIVEKDAALLKGSNPFLEAEVDIYRARLEELYAGYNAQPLHERLKRKMFLEEIERTKGDLCQIEEQLENLLVRSPARGKFILLNERNLPGHFVRQGELLGYIVADHRPTIRAVVSQADIGLLRKRVTRVEVRLAEEVAIPLKASIERIIPAADLTLPSAALGTAGGGSIPIDPSDPEKLRALDSIFQLDLSLPDEVKDPHIGGRVYVRFEHGSMPLAMQWYRSLRQLFLRKFYV